MIPRVIRSFVLAATLAGCSSPPNVASESELARATGMGAAIVFRTVGGPTDEPAVTNELSLSDAVRHALLTSPQIQAALARMHAALADAKQARLLPNPVLSVVLRLPDGGGPIDVEASLTADLIALLTRSGRTRAADARLRASSTEIVSAALDVLSETQQRYVAVQAADQLLAVLQDRVGLLDGLLGVARSRLDAGEGTRLDVLALEQQRVELAVEVRDAQLAQRDGRLMLARLIGRPSGEVDWELPPREPFIIPETTERQWVAAALASRPEVRQREYQLLALGVDAKLARLAPFDGIGPGLAAERDEGAWSVGPGISAPIPVFDFGQHRRTRARALVIEARHELTQARRAVVEECRRAYAAFVAGRENFERVRDELEPLARRRLEQAEVQFRGGQTDITGLLQAESELRSARARRIVLERDSTAAFFRLQRAVGGAGAAPAGPTSQPTELSR